MSEKYTRLKLLDSPVGNFKEVGNVKVGADSKEEMYNSIMEILKNGGEAVVRKRSKNGEKYIEIVEQKYGASQKFEVLTSK